MIPRDHRAQETQHSMSTDCSVLPYQIHGQLQQLVHLELCTSIPNLLDWEPVKEIFRVASEVASVVLPVTTVDFAVFSKLS